MGIGNPGPKYEETRHNVGFDTVDRLAARGGVPFQKERFWNALRARCILGGAEQATLLKPLSYVNLTGPVVRKVMEDLSLTPADLLVIVDDFWLALGRIRIRRRGGDGGHNGLLSIRKALRTEEFSRIRIGIGEPGHGEAVDHVLSRFRREEKEIVERTIEVAADAAEIWASAGVEAAMNRYNQAPEKKGGETAPEE